MSEKYTTGTGQHLIVHDRNLTCILGCPIHSPSDHAMKEWPTHWRDDGRFMERICPHGIGHPDPDDPRAPGIHGCDGCCRGGEDRPNGGTRATEVPEDQRFEADAKRMRRAEEKLMTLEIPDS